MGLPGWEAELCGTDGDGREGVPSLPITDGLGLKVTAFFGIRGVFSVVVVEVEVEAIVAGDGLSRSNWMDADGIGVVIKLMLKP